MFRQAGLIAVFFLYLRLFHVDHHYLHGDTGFPVLKFITLQRRANATQEVTDGCAVSPSVTSSSLLLDCL